MENKWKVIGSSTEFESPFMRLVADDCVHTERTLQHTFYRFEFRDWVNIVPVTPEGKVVLVRQHRWGSDCETLEIPGGTMDAGEEEALAAVRRELVEETGYDSDNIVYMGNVLVNPAIQNNRCHYFLALDVMQKGDQDLDETEDISLEFRSLDEIIPLIKDGTIEHCLGIQGLLYALLTLGTTDNWPRLKK